MLTCDLTRVAMLRYAYCLTHDVKVTPAQLLLKGTASFCAAAGVGEAEFVRFEAGAHVTATCNRHA